ncbi:MAG: ADP-heptose:LPS heptosyltransferase [Bacteroidia bacterium]
MDTEKLLYFGTSLVSTFVNSFKKPPEKVASILVVKLDEIGDMIYILHCIEALGNHFPDAAITVFCKSMNASLIEQTGKVKHLLSEESQLQTYYDIQVDFRGNLNSLKRAIKGKCGIYLDRGSIRLRNKFTGGQRHEVETNQDTIQWLFPDDYNWAKPQLNVTAEDELHVSNLLHEFHIANYVVMHCGARDEARRWPVERFSALIDAIHSKYGKKTVLVGAPNESDLNNEVCSKTSHAVNFAGKTNLIELTALIRKADLFVGNESGPLHFAIVEQKPLVALFGPGVKDVFYPLYPNQKVIHHVSDKDQKTQTAENSTILQITVEEVINKVTTLLKS